MDHGQVECQERTVIMLTGKDDHGLVESLQVVEAALLGAFPLVMEDARGWEIDIGTSCGAWRHA